MPNPVPSVSDPRLRSAYLHIVLFIALLSLLAPPPARAQEGEVPSETSELPKVDSLKNAPPPAAAPKASTFLPAPIASSPGGPAPLTVFFLGDQGAPGEILSSNGAILDRQTAELERVGRGASLLCFLGDNFYPIGLNVSDSLERRALLDSVMAPLRPALNRLGPQNVHAIPGNHDYYCVAINNIPLGFCLKGNYREQQLPEWTYHLYWPSSIRRPIAVGSRDSVEIIFFDSSALLDIGLKNWRPILEELEALLKRSAAAPSVKYRIITAHHSPRSIGEHAGWRLWVANQREIYYMGNCWQEGHDPIKYVYQVFSNQDNCNGPYREYTDSLAAVIERSGARVQAFFAGHDHSLQLLYRPDAKSDLLPKVYVISGAASKRTPVRSSHPPYNFSHPVDNDVEKGRSAGGFSLVSFDGGLMHIWFIDAQTGKPLDMGGGITEFVVDRNGDLQFEKPVH